MTSPITTEWLGLPAGIRSAAETAVGHLRPLTRAETLLIVGRAIKAERDRPRWPDGAVEDGAKILAKWLGYDWDGLSDRDISDNYPDWAFNGIGHKGLQGGKPALRKVAASILALPPSPQPAAVSEGGEDE